MNKIRLENLSDGVFAIIMTLLVIEIHIPKMPEGSTLLNGLWHLTPLFLSYFLSFSILVMFWIQHHALFHFFTKTVNRQLVLLNMIHLSFLCLIPFSANLLGSYLESQTAIMAYGVNVLAASLMSRYIFDYALSSKEIEKQVITNRMIKQAKIRLSITPALAVLGIIIGFFNSYLAAFFFIFPILFNIIPGGLDYMEKVFKLDLN